MQDREMISWKKSQMLHIETEKAISEYITHSGFDPCINENYEGEFVYFLKNETFYFRGRIYRNADSKLFKVSIMASEEQWPDISERVFPNLTYKMLLRFIDAHIEVQKKLLNGYLSSKDALDNCFWGCSQKTKDRNIYISKLRMDTGKERKYYRGQKDCFNKKKSRRGLRMGDRVTIIYPSGKKYPGKLFVKDGLAITEPEVGNTAAYMFNESDLKDNEIQLNKIPHERIIHHNAGLNFIQDFCQAN